MILDTNAISALSAQNEDLLRVLERENELCVTVVTAAEYCYGLQSSKRKNVLARWFSEFLDSVRILDLDRDVFPY